MKMTRGAHCLVGVQNIIFYILLVSVLGLVAFFSREFVWRVDWTYGQRNSLTEPTQKLLATLEEPINFVAYVPDDKQLHEQLKRLVAKYQRTKPNITLDIVNPDLEPVRAQQDGIREIGQMAIHFAGRSEVIESTSESVIANALLRMSRGTERLVVFLEGHAERDPLSEQNNGLSRLTQALERSGFKVQPHSLIRIPAIPSNAQFVVIAAPKQALLSGEVNILRDYVEQGGNLLWLQDPGDLKGLQPLAEALGIRFPTGTVVDTNEQLHQVLGVDHPAIIPIVDYGRSVLGANLTGLRSLFPIATAVEAHPSPASTSQTWQREEFLLTLPNSWVETGALEGTLTLDTAQGDQAGPVSIGLTLTRSPTPALGAETEKTATQAAKPQRVIVVGDSDFLSNSFIGEGVNLDLAMNLFNWLSVDDNLLNVRVSLAPDMEFKMSDQLLIGLAVFFLFGLPLLLAITGLLIWLKRKKG